jgi:hypothetical protein
MKTKKMIAVAASFLTLLSSAPARIYAEDSSETTAAGDQSEITGEGSGNADEGSSGTTSTTTEVTTESQTEPPTIYTITFLDFNGKKMAEQTVTAGEPIDYASVDTSVLHSHINKYTEREFYRWDVQPEVAESDMTLRALYRTAKLSVESLPEKRRYLSTEGDIDTSGMLVYITVETQLPETDSKGQFVIEKKIADISASCAVKPSTLNEAFSDGKTEATVEIFPIGDTKALASYSVNYVEKLGDVNRDGKIDAIDASRLLREYADVNSDPSKEISDEIMKYGDINYDGVINAKDATYVLRYYTLASAHKSPKWEEIAGIK